jgi:hypothetical protein
LEAQPQDLRARGEERKGGGEGGKVGGMEVARVRAGWRGERGGGWAWAGEAASSCGRHAVRRPTQPRHLSTREGEGGGATRRAGARARRAGRGCLTVLVA